MNPKDSPDTMYGQEIYSERERVFRASLKKIGDGRIEVKFGDSFIIYESHFEDSGTVTFSAVEEHIEGEDEKGIVPLIVWHEDLTSGVKTYWCEPVPESVINTDPELFTPRHETMLGQIVVSGYSENIRKGLPNQLCLQPGGQPQKMRGAQSPVVCGFYADKFLSGSPVIKALESLVNEFATS
ncbi:MAG: hypothetical protein CEO21_28 [Microgenomates group bacterium Gr01-1014_80]|nr:MAG: hypothetical protein CEO21_28 [Microgenomates group bacterium Gr01-1014_80]